MADIIDNPFTFENLTWAARECMKGVGWKNGTARWRMNLLGNCRRLERELADGGKYRQGKPNVFSITSPKPRDVSALLLRDRVVHKVICHQGGLIEDMFRNAYNCNCACRSGMGTSYAIGMFDEQLHDFYRMHGCDGFVVSIDIRRFFDSIPHDKLVEWVYRRVRSVRTRKMVRDIINGYPGDRGIGLGSEVSQILANSYLTPVDYVVKQVLGIRHYIRYADNLICLIPATIAGRLEDGTSTVIDGREFAKKVFDGIRYAVSTLGLELNAVSSIHPLRQGVNFLGFRWRLTKSGRVVRTILRKSVGRIRRRLRRLVALHYEGRRTREQVMACYESWAAYAGNATAGGSIRRMKDYIMEALHEN